MFRAYIIVALMAPLLTGCSATSEGKIVPGVKGSPWWNEKAPPQDVAAYYDAMPTHELCSRWDRALILPSTDIVRRHISDSFVRRGEPEDKCFDPNRDMIALLKLATRKRNSYVPPVQPQPKTRFYCSSIRSGDFVSTNCF